MRKLLEEKKVILVGGSGGVGKTTVAASVGVLSAEMGYKTVVLTVDPARRLAQALGFQNFSDELQDVRLSNESSGSLSATMLDSRRYFDRVMEKFAKSSEQLKKIQANTLYQTTVRHLGGTHEYAAMERLYEFAEGNKFERIIVDTPPAQNAVDLLSAPERLASFLDASVLKWFRSHEKPLFNVFRQGTLLAMKTLQKVFGGDFLEQLRKFLEDIEGMDVGFRERNLAVMKLLKSHSTSFLLVSHPSDARLVEAEKFVSVLRENHIGMGGIILNRLEPSFESNAGFTAGSENIAVQKILEHYILIRRLQDEWVSRFRESFPNTPLSCVERKENPPDTVDALSHFTKSLVF